MPLLSVVVPVYNEKDYLSAVLDRIQSVKLAGVEREIVLVDDCSTDGTRDLIREQFEGKPGLVVVYHERNQGKGAALRTGIAKTRGDIVLIQDADLEYDPQDYPKLVAPILEDRADVVYGSRFLASDNRQVRRFWHTFINRGLTTLSNIFTNLDLTDMETCYKVFRGEIIRGVTIQENRFGFEPEVTAKIAHVGCRVYEVPVRYAARSYAEGKKIGWKDGVRALWCIVKYH